MEKPFLGSYGSWAPKCLQLYPILLQSIALSHEPGKGSLHSSCLAHPVLPVAAVLVTCGGLGSAEQLRKVLKVTFRAAPAQACP